RAAPSRSKSSRFHDTVVRSFRARAWMASRGCEVTPLSLRGGTIRKIRRTEIKYGKSAVLPNPQENGQPRTLTTHTKYEESHPDPHPIANTPSTPPRSLNLFGPI